MKIKVSGALHGNVDVEDNGSVGDLRSEISDLLGTGSCRPGAPHYSQLALGGERNLRTLFVIRSNMIEITQRRYIFSSVWRAVV